MILFSIVTALVLYALVAYIRRKTVKPNYTDKIVWITGASSGIGQYLAYEFNRHGAYLILSARNAKQLQRVKNSCAHPENAQVVPLDMSDFKAVRRVTQEVIGRVEARGKNIDVVIQNAGISQRCEFLELSFENHLALYDINVNGPYIHLQSIVPHMIKNKTGQIVGITSQSGKLNTTLRSSYGSSKSAFIAILDSLRSQLKPHGIRVCNVMPGYIKTNLPKNAFAGKPGEKFGKMDLNIASGMEPDAFAKETVGAIFNNENEVSVSNNWMPILGIVLRNLCPDLVFALLYRNGKNQKEAVKNAKTE